MNMSILTVAYGLVLIILGLSGYLGTGTSSLTPLIPVIMGGIILILGILSYKGGNLRKYAMQLAFVLSILGFLGAMPGVWNLIKASMGLQPDISLTASIYRTLMTFVSLAYFIYAFKAFMNAKRIQRVDADNDLPT